MAAGRGHRGLLRPAGSKGEAQGSEGISTEKGAEGGGCQPRSQLYPEPAELWLSQLGNWKLHYITVAWAFRNRVLPETGFGLLWSDQ